MNTEKCKHVWVKFGFPFEGHWYVNCEKCGASRSSKPRYTAPVGGDNQPNGVSEVPSRGDVESDEDVPIRSED